MKNITQQNLFISYSHNDQNHLDDFKTHIAPLLTNGLIKEWHDRKIVAGRDFLDKIDENMNKANIICFLISANFLASKACMDEVDSALKLRNNKGTVLVSIILSDCAWEDFESLSRLLSLPTDIKPIESFDTKDQGWKDVYLGLKKVINYENKIGQLQLTEEFSSSLIDTGLLSKAHPNKEIVLLDDIFVYPILKQYDSYKEHEKTISSEELINNFYDYSKIVLAGENQSGKTTLCMKLFVELRNRNFVPIYISEGTNRYQGLMDNIIPRVFAKQYQSFQFEDVDKEKIVLILDNFHYSKKKEKHLRDIASYKHQIVVVDDIFGLNFKNESLIRLFTHFKINEFNPTLRDKLIRKWTNLKEDANSNSENLTYRKIDKTTELVNTTLGKIIGSGIMPSFPFFILTIISTFETVAKPLNQEITSQGHCYQALIYMYLKKQNIKNQEIDTYFNFLTEFAYYLHHTQRTSTAAHEFDEFFDNYLENYNLPIERVKLLKNLEQARIIFMDSLGHYAFNDLYLFYFFVAKHLSENISECKTKIDSIIDNLHKDENAYIAIFISHHSRDNYILEKINGNADSLFAKHKPATLDKNELLFFDKQEEIILKAIVPPSTNTPETTRARLLETQDVIEEVKNDNAEANNDDESSKELRRSIKTVEVMGRIIKNRAGSLSKPHLEQLFEKAMNVHLRMLTSFFILIKSEENQQEIIDFISNRLDVLTEKDEKLRDKDKRTKLAREFFWHSNLSVIYGIINKTVRSIGSDKLTSIIAKVCDSKNTPASYLLKHGTLMWYNKTLEENKIANEIDKKDFSNTAGIVLRNMISSHCSMHLIKYKDQQRIIKKLFPVNSKKLEFKKSSKRHETSDSSPST